MQRARVAARTFFTFFRLCFSRQKATPAADGDQSFQRRNLACIFISDTAACMRTAASKGFSPVTFLRAAIEEPPAGTQTTGGGGLPVVGSRCTRKAVRSPCWEWAVQALLRRNFRHSGSAKNKKTCAGLRRTQVFSQILLGITSGKSRARARRSSPLADDRAGRGRVPRGP